MKRYEARPVASVSIFFLVTLLLIIQCGKNVYDITDFGAVADGTTLCTDAINQAIEACSEAGGGTVRIPAGTFITGSIHLKSNITLYLEKEAVLKGAANDIDAYDHPEPNPWDAYQDFGHSHFRNALIWGEHLENITITGEGTIHGGGIVRGNAPPGGGDKAISLKLYKNVTISNLKMINGGHFAVLANGCTDMVFSNLNMRTPRDGIDLMACSHVLVENCHIHAIRYENGEMKGGDDAIGIKSDYALGYKLDCEDIVIRDCYLSSGCNGIQFGSETVGIIKNVRVSNCTIEHADKAGLGITSNDGSLIEDVVFSDIKMTKTANPIYITITERGRAPGSPPVGKIRNIKFINIECTDAYGYIKDRKFTSTISGRPGHPVENVSFENVSILYKGGGTAEQAEIEVPFTDEYSPRHLGIRPAYGLYARHVDSLSLNRVSVGFEKPDERPAMIFEHVDGLILNECTMQRAADDATDVILKEVSGFHDRSSGLKVSEWGGN